MENVKDLTADEYIRKVNWWHLICRAKFYNKWNVFMKLKEWPHE